MEMDRTTREGQSHWLGDSLEQLRRVLARAREEEAAFLPNFCSGSVILNVVVIAELLAIIFTLVTRRISVSVIQDFVMISLFVQWIALTSAGALCLARARLGRLSHLRALIMAYLLLLCVTFIVSEAAVWILAAFEWISSPRPEWYSYFHVQNLSVSAIVNALALRYFLAKHELQQRTVSEARAKMQALQSRLRPHFLFNSMNIIASLIRSAPSKAEEAIEDVADLFRMMLGDSENLVPVKNEIAVAQKYLSLETLRLDNRLRISWDVGRFRRTAVMPVLMLQPLLEHAIYHGVEALESGGTINIKLWEDDEMIRIAIDHPEAEVSSRRSSKTEYNVLDDIRKRLQNHYGDAASLSVDKRDGRFELNLALPARGGKP